MSNGHPHEAPGAELLARGRKVEDIAGRAAPMTTPPSAPDEGAYLCGCKVADKANYSLDLFPDGKGGEVLRARTNERGNPICPEHGARLAGHRTKMQIRKGQRSIPKPAGL